tara:strand:- start:9042 stop:9869 length:828 start_codon:yes stop_codon:yes gene_type:complete
MIDRKEFAKELQLREHVRRVIKIVSGKQSLRALQEREEAETLRGLLQELILEAQSAVSATAKHDSTGINVLEDLLKNSNILSVLEKGYKSLTTDKQQRESYRNHILVAVEKSLAPEESRKEAGEDVEVTNLEEDINIDIDNPEDDPDFISVEEEAEPEVDDREEFGINGTDKTGRNKAYTDFQSISKVILDAFDDLDNPEDLQMFEEYLIKNLSLYFDKFESELDVHAVAPAAAEEAEANLGINEPAEEETGAANIELQELIQHLNLDDIIKNLL